MNLLYLLRRLLHFDYPASTQVKCRILFRNKEGTIVATKVIPINSVHSGKDLLAINIENEDIEKTGRVFS